MSISAITTKIAHAESLIFRGLGIRRSMLRSDIIGVIIFFLQWESRSEGPAESLHVDYGSTSSEVSPSYRHKH